MIIYKYRFLNTVAKIFYLIIYLNVVIAHFCNIYELDFCAMNAAVLIAKPV